MEIPLDMSLDDLIKSRNKTKRGRGLGRSRGGQRRGEGSILNSETAGGMFRKGFFRVNARPSSFAIAKPFGRTKNVRLQRGLLEDSLIAAGHPGIDSSTKLFVSNLDYGVTNEDIKELFSEVGKLERYALHYDRNGRSSGSAEVVFTRSADALAAMKRYNNVLLDGKNMKIEIIGTSLPTPVSARVVVGGANGRRKRTVVMTSGSRRARSWGPLNHSSNRLNFNRGSFQRGGRGRGRGRGRTGGLGRGKKESKEKSAEELNKELENYHAEAMNTS